MFQCRQCPRSFNTNAGLYRHLKDVHDLGTGTPPRNQANRPAPASNTRRDRRSRNPPAPSAAVVPPTAAESHESSWHRLTETMRFDGADTDHNQRYALRLSGPASEGSQIANLPVECVIRKIAIEVEGDLEFGDRLGGWAAALASGTGATSSPTRGKLISMNGVGAENLTAAYTEYILHGPPIKTNATDPAYIVCRLQRAAGTATTNAATFRVRAVVWYSDANANASAGLPPLA